MADPGLRGNLETMMLPDVLQWAAQGQKTGILHVRSPEGIAKKIFFKGGRVYSTASSDPKEYLGQFLLSRGLLTEEQLNVAMETQLQTKVMLGQILITVGILEEEELKEILRIKAQENLYDLFLWESGDFHFEDLPEIDQTMIPIALDVMAIIMEGIRRKDEWARIQQVIPNERCVLGKGKKKLKTGKLKSSSMILRLYEAMDGQKNIEEICLHLHATMFELSSIASKFVVKGIAELMGETEKPEEVTYTSVAGKVLKEAETALEEKRHAEAENLFRFLLRSSPSDERLLEGLAKAEKGIAEEFRAEISMEAVLELAVPMAELAKADLTPQEGYLASRVNGEWDVASILKVSPLPEAKGVKAIRKLLGKGIIRVREA